MKLRLNVRDWEYSITNHYLEFYQGRWLGCRAGKGPLRRCDNYVGKQELDCGGCYMYSTVEEPYTLEEVSADPPYPSIQDSRNAFCAADVFF